MRIEVNGEPFDCAEGTTLLALIRARGFEPERVAAEVNGEIARRADFGAAELRDGDRVDGFRRGGAARRRQGGARAFRGRGLTASEKEIHSAPALRRDFRL